MYTINDISHIESLADSYVRQIYGDISRVLTEKGIFGDRSNPLYLQSLDIICRARGLTDVFFDTALSPEEADAKLRLALKTLDEDLSALQKALKE